MSLNKRLIAAGPAPRCGVTGFNATIETGTLSKNSSGALDQGFVYGESSGTGYMAIANSSIYIYNADGSSVGNTSINIGYGTQGLIYHDSKFWVLTTNSAGWRSYTIASSPSETIVGTKPAMINWMCEDPRDNTRYFCGYRYDKSVYTISKSGFLDDTPTVLFSNKINYSSYGDGIGSVTSDGDYIWVMAFNPNGNTTTIRQYDPITWDVYADSDYTTTAIGGSNYLGNIAYNKTNNRMWHARSYSSGANKYVPIVGPTCSTASTYTADFLVVGGGGGGGNYAWGAGGGAGGLRTSYGSTSGGGSSAESSNTLSVGSVYSIFVGSANANASGGASSFSFIRSAGGGRGGYGLGGGTGGSSGGSGGGTAGTDTNAGGAGTSNQGYAGGSGTGDAGQSAGGGGGAGGVGSNAAADSSGNGGAGLSISITGAAVTYAGGGGGGVGRGDATSETGGTGGSSVGGNGGRNTNYGGSGGAEPTTGAANTGSGGGGGKASGNSSNAGGGAAGGTGVVIIRLATSNYSGTTTGSPTVTTSGSDTIIKFTADGTYTA